MVTSWIRNQQPGFAVRRPGAIYETCKSSSTSRTAFPDAAAHAELATAMTAADRRPLGWQASALAGTPGVAGKGGITHADVSTSAQFWFWHTFRAVFWAG